MKAAICYEFGKPLGIEDVQIAPPRRDEVKVRLIATAICHSDVHLVRGQWGGRLPVVAGHEAAGIVEQAGDDVTHVRPGDPVVVSLLQTCGQCFFCRNGTPHLCNANADSQEQPRLHNKRGEPLYRGMRTGAFAEYVVVHESQVVSVPPSMPLEQAALLSCGVITGFGAVINTARVAPRESVAVIGCGGVGLNVVQAAALNGAQPVIAVDIRNTKLDAARRFGATNSINPLCENVVEAARQATAGRGADFAFVTVGEMTAVIQALKLVRRGGTVVVAGIPDCGERAPINIGELVSNEQKIVGCFMGSSELNVDVPWLIRLYQEGRLKLDELITARYTLDQINEAIEATEHGEALRNVIVFDSH